jgi:mannose-6-phosphate isomerase-like protein (cupin superfamily)
MGKKQEGNMKKAIMFLVVGLFLAAGVCPAHADEKSGASKIQKINVSDIKEFSTDAYMKKTPLDTDKFVFNTFYFSPRQILPFHKHPATDELFYIVDGVGQFTLGNENVMVGPGTTVYGPANVYHGLINHGNKELVVISVQSPKPVTLVYADNSTMACPVCRQELILKDDVKEGDIYVCPRCGAKLKVTKAKDGTWIGVQQ